jgi:type IV pilus biogenesis protein CpaD/CtpE
MLTVLAAVALLLNGCDGIDKITGKNKPVTTPSPSSTAKPKA